MHQTILSTIFKAGNMNIRDIYIWILKGRCLHRNMNPKPINNVQIR